jgi:hypothetical protein
LIKAKEYIPDCTRETGFQYIGGFTLICSIIRVFIFGPGTCFKEQYNLKATDGTVVGTVQEYYTNYLFCSLFAGVMDSIKTSFRSITLTINDSLIHNQWLLYLFGAGFAAFILLLIYALYTFINMSAENHEKMKEEFRKKNRKGTRKK